MSTYTGRYVSSHGVTWNRVPLAVGQLTLGDYLLAQSRSLDLIGKSHVIPDLVGINRLGVLPQTKLWKHLASGGFNELDRIDGHGAPGPNHLKTDTPRVRPCRAAPEHTSVLGVLVRSALHILC